MERQRYLWSSAQRALRDGAPALSQVLMLSLDRASVVQSSVAVESDAQLLPPLPARVLQRSCGFCFSVLVPGVTCKVQQSLHRRRPAARRRSLGVRCWQCGREREFPMPARQSARSAIAAVAPAAAPAAATAAAAAAMAERAARKRKSGGGRTPVVGNQSKARRGQSPGGTVLPAAPAPAGADALFGFDFVPL